MRMKSVISMLLLVVSICAAAQNRTITGKVIDSKSNSPLAGVTVTAVGSSVSVATDENGNFLFQLAPE